MERKENSYAILIAIPIIVGTRLSRVIKVVPYLVKTQTFDAETVVTSPGWRPGDDIWRPCATHTICLRLLAVPTRSNGRQGTASVQKLVESCQFLP